MNEQASDVVAEEFGLEGVCSDAYEVIREMAEPWAGTKQRASDLEILIRAMVLQSGSKTTKQVRVVEPERFSLKLMQAAEKGVPEKIFAEALGKVFGVEIFSNV
jgi:hypothetical protein